MANAKYWQFDASLVGLKGANGQYRFFSPGNLLLPYGQIPWFNEGTQAIVVGDQDQQFVNLPYSGAELNRENRLLTLSIGDDGHLKGTLVEQLQGQPARSVRLQLKQATSADRNEKLKDKIHERYADAQVDSLSCTGGDSLARSMVISAQVQLPSVQTTVEDRLVLQPFGAVGKIENPFQSERRQYSVLFDYATMETENVMIALPPGYAVESLPRDTSFVNEAGKCEVSFQSFGGNLSAKCLFELAQPFFTVKQYKAVQDLYRMRQKIDELASILKKG